MLDRLLINANIYTLDQLQPRATALAIHQDRIVAVGGHELKELATAHTTIDDLNGATVLPGLTDAHIHWEGTARALHSIDLMDVPSRAEALLRVEAAATSQTGEWLVGRGWAQGEWPDGAFPTAADLDAVVRNHPVYLAARSGHAAW